jgi:hypothetical protein
MELKYIYRTTNKNRTQKQTQRLSPELEEQNRKEQKRTTRPIKHAQTRTPADPYQKLPQQPIDRIGLEPRYRPVAKSN